MCFEMPARIVSIDGPEARARVDSRERTVSLAVLDLEGEPVETGDWVLVHTGFAIRRLDAGEAEELLQLHRRMHESREAR